MRFSLPERLRALRQEPMAAVRKMGVTEGQRVVDIGAGLGYFTIPAAAIVGGTGMVYAVEPDPARSDKIRKRVTIEGAGNVSVLTAGAEELGGIPSGSVDLAFSAFSLHHFKDRKAALSEVKRVLRSGGVFYVWDRVPGGIIRHGTRAEELNTLSEGFASFELLDAKSTLRARFTK